MSRTSCSIGSPARPSTSAGRRSDRTVRNPPRKLLRLGKAGGRRGYGAGRTAVLEREVWAVSPMPLVDPDLDRAPVRGNRSEDRTAHDGIHGAVAGRSL